MPAVRRPRRAAGLDPSALGPPLDALYRGFDHVESATDPVHIVRRFTRNDDREVVAFCAAGLAFGRVASVLQSIEALLAVMGPSPAAYVRTFDVERERPRMKALVHRWIRGDDHTALMLVLQRMLREHGTIEGFFLAGDDGTAPDLSTAMDSFSDRALATDLRPAYGRVPTRPGVAYFFPRPSAGSACKRLNLFFRWMVRKDAIDLGVWTRVSPARLIIPLDTHIIRLGRCLTLTTRTSPGWKMAVDVTAALRRIDPADPVRFDFSLCHIGMNGACGYGTGKGDVGCPLKGQCHPGKRKTGGTHPQPSSSRGLGALARRRVSPRVRVVTSSGFPPVAGPDARVLILGTLPGAMSLAKGQYYAQPRNAFWRVMADVAGAGPELSYEERLRRLVRQRLALWDVCASATRPGSLDSSIHSASVRRNDFARFLAEHPDIQLICFNGAKAAALFAPVVPTLGERGSRMRRVTLPSTSPAHASMPIEHKVEIWRKAVVIAYAPMSR